MGIKQHFLDKLNYDALKDIDRDKIYDFFSKVSDDFDVNTARVDEKYFRSYVEKMKTKIDAVYNAGITDVNAGGDAIFGLDPDGRLRKASGSSIDLAHTWLQRGVQNIAIAKDKSTTKSAARFITDLDTSLQMFRRIVQGRDYEGALEHALDPASPHGIASITFNASSKDIQAFMEGDHGQAYIRKIGEGAETIGYLGRIARIGMETGLFESTDSFFMQNKAPSAAKGYLQFVMESGNNSDRHLVNNLIADITSPGFGMDMRTAVDAESAARVLFHHANETVAGRSTRAFREVLGRKVGAMLTDVAQSKWGRRAMIGLTALTIFNPNTGSLLLPNQEADGERYDIPTLDELLKTRRKRIVKVRGDSPVAADKIARALGLNVDAGFPGYIDKHIPPPPPGSNNYNATHHRNNPLSLQQLANQVNGIMLR